MVHFTGKFKKLNHWAILPEWVLHSVFLMGENNEHLFPLSKDIKISFHCNSLVFIITNTLGNCRSFYWISSMTMAIIFFQCYSFLYIFSWSRTTSLNDKQPSDWNSYFSLTPTLISIGSKNHYLLQTHFQMICIPLWKKSCFSNKCLFCFLKTLTWEPSASLCVSLMGDHAPNK